LGVGVNWLHVTIAASTSVTIATPLANDMFKQITLLLLWKQQNLLISEDKVIQIYFNTTIAFVGSLISTQQEKIGCTNFILLQDKNELAPTVKIWVHQYGRWVDRLNSITHCID